MPRIDPYVYEGGTLTGALSDQGTVVAANTKRIIQSAALVNTTAAPVLCTVNFVDGGTGVHPKISARPVAAGETYLCPELIGKGINQLGKIQALGLGVSFDYTAIEIV
jgi:hypothetical protein